MDGGRQRADNVEVVFLESNVVGAQASSAADSTGPATSSSVAANSLTLAEQLKWTRMNLNQLKQNLLVLLFK
jgi:hypothetical protein